MSKWPLAKLGNVATVVGGGTPKTGDSENWDGTVPWVTPKDLSTQNSQYIERGVRHITETGLSSCSATLVPAGTVLWSSRAPIGLTAIARNPICTNQGFKNFVPNKDQIDSKYLYHFLRFNAQSLQTYGSGATFKEVSAKRAREITIPLPPLDEQRRIARILDGTTQAINSAFKERSALFKQLVAARFENCFLQEERSWTNIGKYVESTQYGTSSKASDTGPTPILRMGNITYEGQLNFDDMKYIEMTDKEEDKFCLRDGDLLFNRTNSKELVGKTAIYRHDGVADMTFAGYLIRARTISSATPEYISAYLNSRHGKATLRLRTKAIVGMANINASEFKTIPIPAASPEEQSQFAAFYKAAEEAVKMASDAKRLGDELYNSLATRAFAGEL